VRDCSVPARGAGGHRGTHARLRHPRAVVAGCRGRSVLRFCSCVRVLTLPQRSSCAAQLQALLRCDVGRRVRKGCVFLEQIAFRHLIFLNAFRFIMCTCAALWKVKLPRVPSCISQRRLCAKHTASRRRQHEGGGPSQPPPLNEGDRLKPRLKKTQSITPDVLNSIHNYLQHWLHSRVVSS
jgi:hypothetical protein